MDEQDNLPGTIFLKALEIEGPQQRTDLASLQADHQSFPDFPFTHLHPE